MCQDDLPKQFWRGWEFSYLNRYRVNEKGPAKRERRSTAQPHEYKHALSGINCFSCEKDYLYRLHSCLTIKNYILLFHNRHPAASYSCYWSIHRMMFCCSTKPFNEMTGDFSLVTFFHAAIISSFNSPKWFFRNAPLNCLVF
jgi:hypothetical protein